MQNHTQDKNTHSLQKLTKNYKSPLLKPQEMKSPSLNNHKGWKHISWNTTKDDKHLSSTRYKTRFP